MQLEELRHQTRTDQAPADAGQEEVQRDVAQLLRAGRCQARLVEEAADGARQLRAAAAHAGGIHGGKDVRAGHGHNDAAAGHLEGGKAPAERIGKHHDTT